MPEQYFVMYARKKSYEGYSDGILYSTYADAEDGAKKGAAKQQNDFVIFKSYATAKAVVPEIEVIKHTS